jgi:hypothetical protein
MRLLPRTKASPGFRSDVLRKVRADSHLPSRKGFTVAGRLPFAYRMAAAFAMAACVVALVHVATLQHAHRQREALRIERRQLAAELAAVKESARTAEPVLVFEDDKGTRVIVDLDSAVQPASLRHFD